MIHADLADDLPPTEIAALVFRPGVSTAAQVSEVSGRGVGMDAVKATIDGLGGRVELDSQPPAPGISPLAVYDGLVEDVTLERGATKDLEMYTWFKEIANAAAGKGAIGEDYKRDTNPMKKHGNIPL